MEQINQPLTQQEEQQPLQEAQVMAQQLETAEVPELPQERYAANLSAWGARKLLKTIKPKQQKFQRSNCLKSTALKISLLIFLKA